VGIQYGKMDFQFLEQLRIVQWKKQLELGKQQLVVGIQQFDGQDNVCVYTVEKNGCLQTSLIVLST
jgi:hypothetical protein